MSAEHNPFMNLSPAAGDYEVQRQRHLQAFAAQLPGEAAKLTWPLERLHALRDKRLRTVVRSAKARSSWHARRLDHVDPDALGGGDLSALPPMTKADLMAHWDEIVTDRRLTLELANAHLASLATKGPAYLLDEYHVVASGGSSGTRGVFAWDYEGWLSFGLVRDRSAFWLNQHAARGGEPRRAWVAAAHATLILERQEATEWAGLVQSDMRDSRSILENETTVRLIDFDQPVCLLMMAVLHFVGPDDNPSELVKRYRDRLVPGSWLALSHMSVGDVNEGDKAAILHFAEQYRHTSNPVWLRERAEIASFFGDWNLLQPGVTHLPDWRPVRELNTIEARARPYAWCGVAEKLRQDPDTTATTPGS